MRGLPSPRARHVIAAVLLSLLGFGGLAITIAVHEIKDSVRLLVGQDGSVRDVSVSWNHVLLNDVLIKPARGAPGKHAFKAESIDIRPSWLALLQRRVELSEVTVSRFDLVVWRESKGDLILLPLGADAQGSSSSRTFMPTQIRIDRLAFVDGTIQFYDSQVSHHPHHIPLTGVQVEIGPLTYSKNVHASERPHARFNATGNFPGSPGGKWIQKGWLGLDTLDVDMQLQLLDVPIHYFSPYLQRGSQLSFEGGRIELVLHAGAVKRQIDGHGRLTLSHLKLADDGLLSIAQRAALLALEDRNGKAAFDFRLKGPLEAPALEVDEDMSMRIAGGLAGTLGLNIEGIASGVGRSVEDVASVISQGSGLR